MSTLVSMQRLKAWLAEGLILVPTVLLLGLILFTLGFRLGKLTNVAELLPQETEAFFMLNREDYLASGSPMQSPVLSEFYGTSLNDLDWIGRDMGLAKIDGHTVSMLQVKSKENAAAFFTTLFPNSKPVENVLNEEVYCFEAEALCYRFERNLLFSSSSPEALSKLAGKTTVEDAASYQNMRSRLSHLGSAFIYVDLQKNQKEFLAWLSEQGIREPLLLESLLTLFPAWGASIRMEQEQWIMESFTAVSKELIDGAYFHPTERYEQQFLPWTRSFAWEWGAQDLAAQVERLREIFTSWGESSEVIFASSIQQLTAAMLRVGTVEDWMTLLDGESYFGFSSPQEFLFIVELNEMKDAQTVQSLKTQMLQNAQYKTTFTENNGEEKAEWHVLSEYKKTYHDQNYTLCMVGEELAFALAITSEAVIVAGTEELLLNTLDAQMGLSTGRDLSEIEVLLPGSDEIWIFNGAFLPEEHILKSPLSTLTRLMSTRKIFDDGIFSRTSLLK